MNIFRERSIGLAQLLFLLLLTAFAVFPFVMLLLTSLKTNKEFLDSPLGLPIDWTLSNYASVLKTADILSSFLNSLIITGFSLLGQLALGSLAAYALAKMEFKGKGIVSLALLIPLFLPIQTVIIPLYVLYSRLRLVNTYVGMIIIYIAGGLPLVVLTLTGFMKTIPREISEAAFIDGLSHFRTYLRIIMPLLKPAVATVVIISGLLIWNDFYLPLLMLSNSSIATLPMKIYIFVGEYETQWPKICVCITYMVVPLVAAYFVLQKYIIAGTMRGAVKG
jgi:raffinose/stachyose/melibiose transport system permease protein